MNTRSSLILHRNQIIYFKIVNSIVYALISVNWGRLNRLDIISIVPRLFLPIRAYCLLALIDYVSAKISPSIPEFGPK